MKLGDLFPSNYLKKEDVPYPTQATIGRVTQEEISGDGGKELKAVLHFVGTNLKPMILNKGNAVNIAEAYGDDTSAWVGKTIEIYNDPSVMFAGKRVGGVRVRIPAPGQRQAAPVSNAFTNGPTASDRWDIAHGSDKLQNQTTEQVQDFLADCKAPLSTVWIKPAGAGRETAKTADKWNFQVPSMAPANDPIPF